MMKKLLLGFVTGCISLSAMAQGSGKSVVFMSDETRLVGVDDGSAKAFFDRLHNRAAVAKSAAKSTAAAGQWYVPHDMINTVYLSGVLDNNRFVFPIGFDSTQTQKFTQPTPAQYPVNWLSIAQFVDPTYSAGFHDANYAGDGIDMLAGASYQVDSVFFEGAYVENPSRPTTVVDTFIISVAAIPNNMSSVTKSANPDVVNYDGVTDNGDVLKIQNLPATDPVNKTLAGSAIVWKEPLIDTFRTPKSTSGTYTTRGWTFKVPGGLNVPSNNGFAVTVTFKPGETWTPGDSVQANHYFMPTAGYNATGAYMPYFYYTQKDRNMSYLMHYSQATAYIPTLLLETYNQPTFSYEYLNMGGFVSCGACWTLNAANVTNNLSGVSVYPNPANNEVKVSFSMNNASDVRVNLTTAVGQVLATQTFSNAADGTATFSTANLANGLYFYTIEANGERKTGRVVVAH